MEVTTHEIPSVPMQLTLGCLVASIQIDLTTAILNKFQTDLLERIQKTGVKGVILDVSGVQIMDVNDFDVIRRSMVMARVMGARPVLVGLRPGIVASLIQLDGNVDGIEAAADLDDALGQLASITQKQSDQSTWSSDEVAKADDSNPI